MDVRVESGFVRGRLMMVCVVQYVLMCRPNVMGEALSISRFVLSPQFGRLDRL